MTSGNRTSDTFGSGHSALEWGYEKSMVAAHTLPSRHREERNITDSERAIPREDRMTKVWVVRDVMKMCGTGLLGMTSSRMAMGWERGQSMTRCAFEEPLCR